MVLSCTLGAFVAILLVWLQLHSTRVEQLVHELHELPAGGNFKAAVARDQAGASASSIHADVPAWLLPSYSSHPDEVKDRLRSLFAKLPPLAQLKPNASVFLTFANGHYAELMLNAVATIAALGLPAVVYCLDQEAVEVCLDHGIPHMQPDGNRFLPSGDFRQDTARFLESATHKVSLLLSFYLSAAHFASLPVVWMSRGDIHFCASA